MSLSKIVVLFLVVIAVLAMFGRLRLPRLPGGRAGRGGFLRSSARRCDRCGRHMIGGACVCKDETGGRS